MPKTKKIVSGYMAVADTRDNQTGRFTSPNKEPLGGSHGVRLPLSLDEWVTTEAKRRGCSKNELIREAVKFFRFNQESIA